MSFDFNLDKCAVLLPTPDICTGPTRPTAPQPVTRAICRFGPETALRPNPNALRDTLLPRLISGALRLPETKAAFDATLA